jgi:hypothetical protein
MAARAQKAPSLDHIRSATPGSKRENRALAQAWLRETFPVAFGPNACFPVDPECLSVPQREARQRGVPTWLWPYINGAVGSRNHSATTRQLIAAPRVWWRDLDGRPRRPVSELERRR